ncbi:MAG: hypothetical protein HXY34_03595 [Candidatus Thorarchaeota archaeon]|nr:hypothetical protein [Candidatus Thorarchaeota archaeon]
MAKHSIQAILIMERGGIPLFFLKLDPRAQDLDPLLVSGFFSAMQLFSKEVIDGVTPVFQVDYGARLFTVISGESTDLVAISEGRWEEGTSGLLLSLLQEFEQVWFKNLTHQEKDHLNINTCFPSFRESVIHMLEVRNISETWVPFIREERGREIDSSMLPTLDLIDGNRTVEVIAQESTQSRDEVISRLTLLWALGTIDFRNVLNPDDVVVATSRLDRLLQSSSPQRIELAKKSAETVLMLSRLVPLLDGRRTMGSVLAALREHYSEEKVRGALDTLLSLKAVETLSPEKRRILLLKEATDIAIRVAEKAYSKTAVSKAMEGVLNKMGTAEVAGDLMMSENSWTVNYGIRLYEGMNPRRLMEVYAEWMKVLAQFVEALDAEGKKKYIEGLCEAYQEYLLQRYGSGDLRGFEEMTFWLEMASAER